MKILLLAPHPFYQERGTPIAVALLLQALSKLGHKVDVLTYHEGNDVSYPGLNISRIKRPPLARNVPPGPSIKKIICDLYMLPAAFRMVRANHYDLIHAVEESAYMAMLIHKRWHIPYLYDMDSSLARQIAEKFPFLRMILPLMTRTEGAAIRRALAVIPVCDALAEIAKSERARHVTLLRDISLLSPSLAGDQEAVRSLIPNDGLLNFMYVGNLEGYQGVDLLLDSFARFRKAGNTGRLVIAGGKETDIIRYRNLAATLGIIDSLLFLGPQPVSRMATLFAYADVLVSPRIKGNNTPMKIYSYLASGRCVLATNLPTHTQVLTPGVAMLAEPDTESFANAMTSLARDKALRDHLAREAKALATQCYSKEAFEATVSELYSWVQTALARA